MKDDVKVESSGGTETAATFEVLVSMPDRKIKVGSLHCICKIMYTLLFNLRVSLGFKSGSHLVL